LKKIKKDKAEILQAGKTRKLYKASRQTGNRFIHFSYQEKQSVFQYPLNYTTTIGGREWL